MSAPRPLPDFYPALVAKIRARLVPDPARAGCLIFPQKRGRHTRINFDGRSYSPHRVIAEWEAGELFPRKIDACHTCDNERCCLPAHLFRGTRRDNVMDAVQKGRITAPLANARAMRKLDDAAVRWARREHASGVSARAIGRQLGINHKTIVGIMNGSRYADVRDDGKPVQLPIMGASNGNAPRPATAPAAPADGPALATARPTLDDIRAWLASRRPAREVAP
jgi:hypothetical protein